MTKAKKINNRTMTIKEFIGQKVIYDDAGQMIFGVDEKEGHQLLLELSLRGWGAISSQFQREGKTDKEAAEFQDQLGQWITDAINEKLNKWIAVKDKLPPIRTQVIAYFPKGTEGCAGKPEISTGIRYHEEDNTVVSDFPNSTAYCFEASHWMLKPEPPVKSPETAN